MKSFKTAFVAGMVTALFFTGSMGTVYGDEPDEIYRAGSLNKFKSVSAPNWRAFNFSGDTYPIPNMERTFRTKKTGKLVITVSVSGACNDEVGMIFFSISVDGNPGLVEHGFFDDWGIVDESRTTSFTVVSKPVGPGQHTVSVHWFAQSEGSVSLRERSLVIQHN